MQQHLQVRLPLHYNHPTLQYTTPHHTTFSSWPVQPLQKAQLQPSFTFWSTSGFALPSMHHNNSPLLLSSILETSATALCGTTHDRDIVTTRVMPWLWLDFAGPDPKESVQGSLWISESPPSLVLASVVDSRTSLRLYLLGRLRLPHSVRDHGTPRMQKHFSGIARILPHLSFYFNLKVAQNGSWGMTYITCKQATWTSQYGEVGAAIR